VGCLPGLPSPNGIGLWWFMAAIGYQRAKTIHTTLDVKFMVVFWLAMFALYGNGCKIECQKVRWFTTNSDSNYHLLSNIMVLGDWNHMARIIIKKNITITSRKTQTNLGQSSIIYHNLANAFPINIITYWLVVDLPLWKIWKSVGMMKFPIYMEK